MSDKLFRLIQITGNILILGLLVMFGYYVEADPPFDAANRALVAALMLHVLVVGIRLIGKSRQQQTIWQYVASKYRVYPSGLMDAPQAPIDFSLASPTIGGGVDELRLGDIYEVVLEDGRLAFLTQINTRRNIFGRYLKDQWGGYTLSYLVLAVKLDTPTPHIFIDGRSQNRFGRRTTDLWSLTKRLSGREKIQDLEGDFSKYFDVYSPAKEYLGALTIMTPDVMLALRDKGYSFDYEIHDGNLYVMHEPQLSSVDEMKALVDAMQICLKELIPQITKHKYEDAYKELTLRSSWLNLWALLLSVRIVGIYIAKVFTFFAAGVLLGTVARQLFG